MLSHMQKAGFLMTKLIYLNFKDQCQHQSNESFEPQHNKTNNVTKALSEDSDQTGYAPCLIRAYTVCIKEHVDPSFTRVR